MTQVRLRGSCLCGAVRYEIAGDPSRFYHCHCRRCRKSTGTGHATNLFLQPGTVEWLAGEGLVRSYKVPEAKRFTRQFCAACGSALPRFVPELGGIVAPAGSLDEEPPIRPQARIFWDFRASWSCDGEALPTHAGYAPA